MAAHGDAADVTDVLGVRRQLLHHAGRASRRRNPGRARGGRSFPRPGDQFDVDAANPGLNGERFTHGSGPVFRMVIALGPDQVEGRNILPGGQSGITRSEHFDDQVRLWLGNETIPMRFTPEDVVEGGVGREVLVPAE